jgi:hypothetical protein
MLAYFIETSHNLKSKNQERHKKQINKNNMKQLILVIAAVALIAFNGIAQGNSNDLRSQITFGIKAGTNYSNVYDSQNQDFNADSKFGFVGGVFVGIPLGQFLGIQPELLYSQKGFKATGSLLGSPYSLTRTTNYLDVPLLIALKPIGLITILAGPQYSYLLSQKNVYDNSIMTVQQEQTFKNENIRKNIFGFLGGIDINISNLVIGARVGWDITNNNGDGTSTTPRYKNVYYQATLGYRF